MSVSGLTGSVTAAHVHAQSPSGFNSGVIVTLCTSPSNPCTLSNGQPQTFTNIDIPLGFASVGNAYLNFHTDANKGGEVRGQIMSFMNPPAAALPPATPTPVGSMSTVTFALSSFQEALASTVTLPFVATFDQEVFAPTCIAPAQLQNLTLGRASFDMTLSPQGTVSFSAIQISGLSSDLTGAHIHGPCPTGTRCNAGVVYHICGGGAGSALCPTGVDTIIPAFMANTSQSSDPGFATFFHKLGGSEFYYVNLHTQKNPNGELRADLMLPQGSVTVVYDATATPASTRMTPYNQVLAISASITISLTGMTSTPSMIHLHEPAGLTATAGVLVTLCNAQTQPPCIFNGGTQTFPSISLPIRLLNGNLPSLSAWPYWNVHTSRNPGGEVRGRTVQIEDLPTTSSSFTRAAVTFFEDALCTRLSFDLQKQNMARFSPMKTPSGIPTPSGLPNPVIFRINECVASPVFPNVWERVSMNGCDGGSVVVTSFRDASCIQIRSKTLFSKQCSPVTFPGVTLFARATCSAQSLPASEIRRPFLSTVPLNVLQLNQGPVSFTYTATSKQEPPPAFVSSCARATFSVTFGVDRSISFSDIILSGFTSSGNLNAIHIHGPCPLPSGVIGSDEGFVPCNAPPIYAICSGGTCPSGNNPRIPAFVVNKLQPFGSTDSSFLIGLYESILSGNNLYYVNFHSDR